MFDNFCLDNYGAQNKETILESNIFLPLDPDHFSSEAIYVAAESFVDRDQAKGILIIEGSTYVIKGEYFHPSNVKRDISEMFLYLTGNEPISMKAILKQFCNCIGILNIKLIH